MASINGIQIKNLKRFVGMEGDACQGDIWLNGKKLGFWSQDGDGGDDRFDFEEKLLNEAVIHFKNEQAKNDQWCIDAGYLLNDLVFLMEKEKAFKKAVKKGYKNIVLVTDGYHLSWISTCAKDPLKDYAKDIEDMKKQMFQNKEISVELFTSKEDFEVNYTKPLSVAMEIELVVSNYMEHPQMLENEQFWSARHRIYDAADSALKAEKERREKAGLEKLSYSEEHEFKMGFIYKNYVDK